MLAAIQVPGLHPDPDDALGPGRITRVGNALKQRRIIIYDHTATPHLQASAALVVDEEQQHTVVLGQIADGDVLPVAGIVRESERPIIQHLEKARRPPAMLHMRPAIAAGRGDEETIGGSDERHKIVVQPIVRRFPSLDAQTVLTCAIARLRRLDRACKPSTPSSKKAA